MKLAFRSALLLVSWGIAHAETSTPGVFRFSLLPKAFTANPNMEMTAFTEFTDYGRTLPAVSPQQPVYYVVHDKGFQSMGLPVGGEHPPVPAELERILQQSLMERGFLPAEGSIHLPTLALIFYWGSHNAIAIDDGLARLFPEMRRQYIIERATLVGGPAYARQVTERLSYGLGARDYSTKQRYLFYQADHDLYYVVVSAYDYGFLAHNQPRLAWRTTMTVNAQGVSMQQTLPPLIQIAAEYLGRPTDEAVALQRKVRSGTVSLGPLHVVEENVTMPHSAPDK